MTEPKDNVIQFKAKSAEEAETLGFSAIDDETIEKFGKMTAVMFKMFWANLDILYGVEPDEKSSADQTLMYNAFVGMLMRQAGFKHQLHAFADKHHAGLLKLATDGDVPELLKELEGAEPPRGENE